MTKKRSPELSQKLSQVSFSYKPFQYFPCEKETVLFYENLFWGRALAPEDYASLSGNSSANVKLFVGTTGMNIYIEYINYTYCCTGAFSIYQEFPKKELVLFNESIRFLSNQHLQERKYEWFLTQKKISKQFNISKIRLNAARSQLSKGYFYYPNLGFNMKLESSLQIKMPRVLKKCKSILDLFETKHGIQWWFDNGESFEGVFHMTPKSRSQIALSRYEPL